MRAALVLLIAFAAALLAGMSGGSASALTTPAWLAMGVLLPTAVATDKLAGALWTLLGALLTVRLDPALLKRAVGGVILVFIGVMMLRPRLGAEPGAARLSRAVVGVFALPLGFYKGMLGVGNSLAATLLFCWGRGYDLIGALGHYYVLAFFWCALAAASYIGHGYADSALMIPAIIGSSSGGYLGSRIASLRGTGFVRGLFVVVGLALGFKLLLAV